ncbi:uncharacterized protein L969DRAFT_47693 [Mixia osmundae IAM 14324]|uniref:HotDog ACOT-type domain-containing protein n=1 Tax=Mixia osmundae (strain CBS 9802 / IAM 14324 / JCM 22182 / KY 12970) TaxID=764103 RepID=G7E6E5_MIXOS|nr:uncharacterized protein L969DRAFT_47693 [Mixia osmundae IAM 14324]KEI40437.1 hypothetical protein L969DRAFT_47693 [Mixia osmundae IAM 14324]GAA98405.1 hypothetical protein E5Q_05091 [Mixia osmundae IAM 14324]
MAGLTTRDYWLAVITAYLITQWLTKRSHLLARLTRLRQNLPAGPSTTPPAIKPGAKPVAASSFTVSYRIGSGEVDSDGRAYGGELLKLIDVVAGVAARKHSGHPCVTVSVDRVIFLSAIRAGDIVHLSASVNRAWSSSLETGVRCMREDGRTGEKVYACQAYLTFVGRSQAHGKTIVPEITPLTVLEQKRFFLAGRRRGHRIKQARAWQDELTPFRNEVLAMSDLASRQAQDQRDSDKVVDKMAELEKRFIAEAYLRNDPDIRLEGEYVIAQVEGYTEPLRVKKEDIDKITRSLGSGAWQRVASRPIPTSHPRQSDHELGLSSLPLHQYQSYCLSLYIVRPQHCNSLHVLFGGQLMRWLEELAGMSASSVRRASWTTASLDSMTFKQSVHPGQIVYIRSIVTKVWASSIEVYCVATAETPGGTGASYVADAFLTLVGVDAMTGRPKVQPKRFEVATKEAASISRSAEARKQERLADKQILVTMYA